MFQSTSDGNKIMFVATGVFAKVFRIISAANLMPARDLWIGFQLRIFRCEGFRARYA